MMNALVTSLASLALTVGAMIVPAPSDAAAAAACSTRSSGTVSGGYRATVYCDGAGFIDGYASTLTGANQEALLLYQIYVEEGVDCSGRSTGGETGGYRITLYCSGAGFIDDYGSTLSDAAYEARKLAELYATGGPDCSGRSVGRKSGGYVVTLYCSPSGFIDGVGETLTGAAQNARLAASIG